MVPIILLCISILVIVLLVKKMNSMKARFETELQSEKKRADHLAEEAQKKADAAIKAARSKAESEIKAAREFAEQQIREYKEQMEAQREELLDKDEKTLMVDTLLGLRALGERLGSLKGDIDLVATRQLNYYDATADVIISNSKAMMSVEESVDSLKSIAEDIKSDVSSIYCDTGDIKSKLESVQSIADDIKSETSDIYYKMN